MSDDIVADSADLQYILSAVGEADLVETLALQEAIMQSQMPTVTASGINDFCFANVLACVHTLCLKKNRTPVTFSNNSNNPISISTKFGTKNRQLIGT